MGVEEMQNIWIKFAKMHLCVVFILAILDLFHVINSSSEFGVTGFIIIALMFLCDLFAMKYQIWKRKGMFVGCLVLELFVVSYFFVNVKNLHILGLLVLLIIMLAMELTLQFDFTENYNRGVVLTLIFLPLTLFVLIKLFIYLDSGYSDIFAIVCLTAGVLMFTVLIMEIVSTTVNMIQEKLFEQRRLADSMKDANIELQVQQEKINKANELLGLQKLKLEAAYKKMHEMAVRDGLTGIYNRGHLNHIFDELCENSKVSNRPISVALFDIDHFKLINDTYGHLFGDSVIVSIAQLAKQIAEKNHGIAARYGGEEFVVVFPGKKVHECIPIVEEIKQNISDYSLKYNDDPVNVHVSVGITSYPEICKEPIELLNHADWAMYYSKKNGRNRITVDSDEIREIVKQN